MPCARRRVLVQDPHRRRREVVELAAPAGPRVGPDEDDHHHDRQRDQDVEDTHAALREKVRLRQAPRMAVTELTGMRIAATIGSSKPDIASVTATAL